MPGFSILPRCALIISITFIAVTRLPFPSSSLKVPSASYHTRGPCGPGEFFSDAPKAKCKPCRPHVPNRGEILISNCTPSHDAIFHCRDGFFRNFDAVAGESCMVCSECGISDPSAPITAVPCGLYSDTLCCKTRLKHYSNGTWKCGGQVEEKQMAEYQGTNKSEHNKNAALVVSELFRSSSSKKNDSTVDTDHSKNPELHPRSSWRAGAGQMSEEEWDLRIAGVCLTLGSLGVLGCVLFTKVFLENRKSLKIAFGRECHKRERRRQRDHKAYGTFSLE